MPTTISGDTGIIFPDATTQSKAVSQATPFAVTASSGAGAQLQLPEATANGSNYVALKAPNALAADVTFTLPSADGTNGQVLQTNGSGALTFGTVATVSIEGPAAGSTLYTNTAQTFTITNFDSYTTYTLVTSNGTVTRSGSTITYTPATPSASASFTVNGVVVGPFVIVVIPAGQQAYTTPGTYTWVCPTGVTSVSVVCVGGGAGGGGYGAGAPTGGALGYKNNIAVTPGTSYTIVVGAGGTWGGQWGSIGAGGQSTFSLSGTGLVGAEGGKPNTNGSGGAVVYSNPLYSSSGGRGVASGSSWSTAGGGAGGYTGDGGDGGNNSGYSPTAGSGGGGGAGYGNSASNNVTAAGGGVGILGAGANGAAGAPTGGTTPTGGAVWGGGGGGSGGAAGGNGGQYGSGSFTVNATGGAYGGAGGSTWHSNNGMTISGDFNGGSGAVRIIWAGGTGITRAFPSTNTGDL